MKRRILCMALLACSLFLHGQAGTGGIFGRVTDPKGATLADVAISLTGGSTGRQDAVTDGQGRFRFRFLPPAEDYQLTAEIDDYKTGVCRDVTVLIGMSTEVDFHMQPGPLGETVSASARLPSSFGAFPRSRLQSLPTSREPYAVLALAPGIEVDRSNFAGLQSAAQASAVGRGLAGTELNSWSLDGLEVGDPALLGSAPGFWDFDAIEQLRVTSGGDVTRETAGIALHIASRRGGNKPSLGGRFYMTDGGFQGDNLSNALEDKGITGFNQVRTIRDYGFNLGGAIAKNRVFYWLAVGVQDLRTRDSRGVDQDALLSNYAFKLDLQPFPADRLQIFLHSGSAAGIGDKQDLYRFGNPTLKIQNDLSLGNDIFVSLAWSKSRSGSQAIATLDPARERFQFRNVTTGAISRSDDFDIRRDPKTRLALQGTYYMEGILPGRHEILLGAEICRVRHEEFVSPGATGTGVVWTDFSTPQFDADGDGQADIPGPEWRLWANHRPTLGNFGLSHLSAYLQDSVTFGRLLLSAGLRFDRYQPSLPDVELDGMPVQSMPLAELLDDKSRNVLDNLFPAAYDYGQKPADYRWSTFSPRAGLAWDLKGDGRSVARLSFAMYGEPMSASTASLFAPGSDAWMNFWWKDLDGNDQITYMELFWLKPVGGALVPINVYKEGGSFAISDPGLYNGISWGGFDWLNSSLVTAAKHKVDGWSSPRATEILASFDRELTRNWSFSLVGTYRLYDRFNWSVPMTGEDGQAADNPSAYRQIGLIPAVIPAASGDLGTGEAAGRPWYVLDESYASGGWTLLEKRRGYSRHYWAVDLLLQKKLADRWMLQGSFTWQNQRQRFGDGSYADPTSIWAYDGRPYAAFSAAAGTAGQYFHSRWLAKVSGLLQLFWDISLAAAVSAHEGAIVESGFYIRDTALASRSAAVWIPLSKFGSARLPVRWDLSLHAEKKIRLGDQQAVYLVFDLFNPFNLNTIDRQTRKSLGTLTMENGVFSSFAADASGGTPVSIVDPRVFRLGVRFQI